MEYAWGHDYVHEADRRSTQTTFYRRIIVPEKSPKRASAARIITVGLSPNHFDDIDTIIEHVSSLPGYDPMARSSFADNRSFAVRFAITFTAERIRSGDTQ
jgi:hypothetical protein